MSLTFIDQVLAGTAALDDVDDFVSAWHDSKTDNGSLSSFLGMTEEEYGHWAIAPDVLEHIVAIRRISNAARLAITHAVAKETGKIN